MNPLVSAVIPVYNGSNYLREAIDSILNQTYPNIEVLVVDDGSTDDTWNIIQSYGDKIRGFHKENGGVSSALNVAIDNMEGEWFAWLSHDDLWLPNKIEMQIQHLLKNPGKGVYYSGYYYINPEGKIICGNNGCWYSRGSDLRHMLRTGNYIHGITSLIKRECFDTIGKFDEKLRYTQDYEIWFRIAQQYELALFPMRLAKTRLHLAQTGNIKRNQCAVEFRQTRIKLLNMTNSLELFPEFNNASISKLKKHVLGIYVGIYLRYLSFSISKNLPTLRMGIFGLGKKILPKSVICYIVRKLDRDITSM